MTPSPTSACRSSCSARLDSPISLQSAYSAELDEPWRTCATTVTLVSTGRRCASGAAHKSPQD